jgi:uncharacterized protein (DUF1800 family)
MERRRTQQQAANQPAETATDKRDMRTPAQVELMQGERRVFTDLAQQKILRAIYSDRQLNEVMVDFWFNHFNVFAGKGQTRNYLTEYERDAIRPHVLGGFRDLWRHGRSPAMLFYLDNWRPAPGAPRHLRPTISTTAGANPHNPSDGLDNSASLPAGRFMTPPAAQSRRRG